MQERHINRKKYFDEQAYTTEKYVIPFIENVKKIITGLRVLEIGCGEAGNLKPFLDRGCYCTGIDLSSEKIKNGKEFFSNHIAKDDLNLIVEDIYNWNSTEPFDLIIMRDVLEHIHDQDNFLAHVKHFLKDDGIFFLGFPPWQNPFGGHQQICDNKILSKLPFIHLLNNKLYIKLLELGHESQAKIANLVEVKETRITIERFLRIVKKNKYRIIKREFYLINPNYEVKFKIKTRKQFFNFIPWFRNFIITTCYFIIEKE